MPGKAAPAQRQSLRVQAAAQNKADDQQRRTADPKIQAGDGERIHLLGHGLFHGPASAKITEAISI